MRKTNFEKCERWDSNPRTPTRLGPQPSAITKEFSIAIHPLHAPHGVAATPRRVAAGQGSGSKDL